MQTLFEIMQNSETLSRYVNDEKVLAKSIQWHLSELLNTRRGSIVHLPDYGIPDILEVYLTMPESIQKFNEEIIQTIEKYEPRIKKASIQNIEYHQSTSVVSFDLCIVTYTNHPIKFETSFDQGCQVSLEVRSNSDEE